MAKMQQEDFNEEMKEYVTDIIQNEFTNVEVPKVLEKLFEKTKGDSEEAHDEVIYEVIEELGGEPYDPSIEEDDYEEEEDEGDY